MKSGCEELVCGESVVYALGMRAPCAGVVADALKSTAAFRLFAKCGVQRLVNCTGRSALRCT